MQTQQTFARPFGQLMLCIAALLLSAVALADSTISVSGLLVEESSGAVKLRILNKWQSPLKDMVLVLPVVVSTGDDGSIKLRQGDTTISVAANTALEFYAGSESGSLLQRVVQNQGSAFYDVAPQKSNVLRVETPYLAAVIKGTEFDVTIAGEMTSISLFEGQLQIEAADIGDVVQLFEGQIAKRHKNDARITILNMQDGEPIARVDARTEGGAGSGSEAVGGSIGATSESEEIVDLDGNIVVATSGIDLGAGIGVTGGAADLGLGAGAELGAGELVIGLDAELDLGLDAGLVDIPIVEVELILEELAPDIIIPVDDLGELLPDPGGLLGL